MSGERNEGTDRTDTSWQAVRFHLGLGNSGHSEILWRCDALRAGKLYSRTLFGTQAEAEEFVQKMQRAEPDQMFNVESIKASSVWN